MQWNSHTVTLNYARGSRLRRNVLVVCDETGWKVRTVSVLGVDFSATGCGFGFADITGGVCCLAVPNPIVGVV